MREGAEQTVSKTKREEEYMDSKELTQYVANLEPEKAIWINNSTRPAASGETFPVIDPATTRAITEVSSGTAADAIAALDAAASAQPEWAARSPRERAEILRRGWELMIASAKELASLMSWENGKAYTDSLGEASYAAEFFRWFSEEAVRSDGDYAIPPAGGSRTLVTARPVGVCALITPWNFPAAMATRKIAPALAAGNAVVLKPASETPLTALAIMRILKEAGVPDGVVNLVPSRHSAEISETWLADPRVRLVSFTGSTPVGRTLLGLAAPRVVNTAMELGGNAAFVVGATADVDAAIEGLMVAKFRNGGQACTAANRIYLHKDIKEEFTKKLCQRVEALKVGAGLDPETEIGTVVNEKAKQRMNELLSSALDQGAKVLAQAALPQDLAGYFVAPTVIEVPRADSPLLQNEIFGPLAPIKEYSDEDELLEMVNGTEMGLASYVYGDLNWALHLAERIEAGMIGVNRGLVSDPSAPFGGVKQSGIGREGAREGIREFQEVQYFSLDW